MAGPGELLESVNRPEMSCIWATATFGVYRMQVLVNGIQVAGGLQCNVDFHPSSRRSQAAFTFS